MEPFVRMDVVCFEEVDIPDSGLMKVDENNLMLMILPRKNQSARVKYIILKVESKLKQVKKLH